MALGGDSSKVVFTIAYTVEKGASEGVYSAEMKPVCAATCQLDYSWGQFMWGTVPEPGGPWLLGGLPRYFRSRL